MFSTHPKTNFVFQIALNLSSAFAFDLDQAKILSFGKELNYGRPNSFLKENLKLDACLCLRKTLYFFPEKCSRNDQHYEQLVDKKVLQYVIGLA